MSLLADCSLVLPGLQTHSKDPRPTQHTEPGPINTHTHTYKKTISCTHTRTVVCHHSLSLSFPSPFLPPSVSPSLSAGVCGEVQYAVVNIMQRSGGQQRGQQQVEYGQVKKPALPGSPVQQVYSVYAQVGPAQGLQSDRALANPTDIH